MNQDPNPGEPDAQLPEESTDRRPGKFNPEFDSPEQTVHKQTTNVLQQQGEEIKTTSSSGFFGLWSMFPKH